MSDKEMIYKLALQHIKSNVAHSWIDDGKMIVFCTHKIPPDGDWGHKVLNTLDTNNTMLAK